MSDTEREAAEARSELRLTQEAFDQIREELIEEAVSAKRREDAMVALTGARVVDDVRLRLRAKIDSQHIEEAAAGE